MEQPEHPYQTNNPSKNNRSVKIAIFVVIGIVGGVILIGVIGIILVAMAPQFIDIKKEARAAYFEGMKGAISSGINMHFANQLAKTGNATFPQKLDSNPDGTCKTCFSEVLEKPVENQQWTKQGLTYFYGGKSFTYNPKTGKLE